jgi:hypothetical protein
MVKPYRVANFFATRGGRNLHASAINSFHAAAAAAVFGFEDILYRDSTDATTKVDILRAFPQTFGDSKPRI